MQFLKTVVMTTTFVALCCSFAFAAGSVEKGKALFDDPNFAGGTS